MGSPVSAPRTGAFATLRVVPFRRRASRSRLPPGTSGPEAEAVAVESLVMRPQGAKSVYFRDPDGNLAELVSPGFWTIS